MFEIIYDQGVYELGIFLLIDEKNIRNGFPILSLLSNMCFFAFIFIFNQPNFKNSKPHNQKYSKNKNLYSLISLLSFFLFTYLQGDFVSLIKNSFLFIVSATLYRNYK